MSKMQNFYFLSKEDVETVIKSALGFEFRLKNYYFQPYSEEKKGFLGSHWSLVASVENEANGGLRDHKFFIKTIPYEPEQKHRPALETDKNELLFYKETNFYKHIEPKLSRYIKNNSCCARCFMVTDEFLVFEDLKEKNFTMKSGLLNTTALKSTLTSLAKLHASSVLAEKRLGKRFDEVYPRMMEESLFTKKSRMYEWFFRGVDLMVALAKKYGYADTSRIPEVCDVMFRATAASTSKQNVVCHGDAWSNNLLFDDAEPLPTCVMVDYQMTRYAPPMVDVVQLFYLTTRHGYREEHEESLLKHYHEVFCDIVREYEPELELQTFEELLVEYEEMRIVGVISVFMYFPIPLACDFMSHEFINECNGIDALLYDDRVDIVLNFLKKYQEFDERLSENMAEFMNFASK